MIKEKDEVIEYINSLKGYRGYLQFSHREIDVKKDVFIDKDPLVCEEEGFVYEAHFANEKESITIRQIDDKFLVTKTDISQVPKEDINSFLSITDQKVKMAQIWVKKEDQRCLNLKAPQLKAVVFAGFEKGDRS